MNFAYHADKAATITVRVEIGKGTDRERLAGLASGKVDHRAATFVGGRAIDNKMATKSLFALY